MRAGGPDSPRAKALAEIKDLLSENRYAPVRVIYAGLTPRMEPARLDEETDLLDRRWTCLQSDFQLQTAMIEAAGLHGANTRALVITDHEPPASWNAENAVWWAFGKSAANTGIVSAVRGDGGRCVVEIFHAGDVPRDVSLSISGALSSSFDLQLDAGEKKQLVFSLQDNAMPLSLSLQDDDLQTDNHAWLAPPRRARTTVKVDLPEGAARRAVLEALAAIPEVTVDEDEYDLLVTDQPFSRDDRERPGLWTLHLPAASQGAGFAGPYVTNADHALLEGIDLSGVIWYAGRDLSMPGLPLITLGEQTLLAEEIIYAPGAMESRHFSLNYLVDRGTLHRTPNWPILFWNMVRLRSRLSEGLERANIQLGEAIQVRVSPGTGNFQVISQDETREISAPRGTGLWQPSKPGVYQLVTSPTATHTVAVNALSAKETDLRASGSGRSGAWSTGTENVQTTNPAGMIFLALALLLFMAHAWLTRAVAA
jgi:hypothetical protein